MRVASGLVDKMTFQADGDDSCWSASAAKLLFIILVVTVPAA